MRWELIPYWAKDDKGRINARSESVVDASVPKLLMEKLESYRTHQKTSA